MIWDSCLSSPTNTHELGQKNFSGSLKLHQSNLRKSQEFLGLEIGNFVLSLWKCWLVSTVPISPLGFIIVENTHDVFHSRLTGVSFSCIFFVICLLSALCGVHYKPYCKLLFSGLQT